jgi:DNA-binding Xre family transcriptional regulator
MKTRIRDMRRQRGMTLQQLAEAIRPEPTTPQTIGRLETGVRTVSLDWLARIAEALDCHIGDLLEMPDRPEIPLIGMVGSGGLVTDLPSGLIELMGGILAPVAVRMGLAMGGFREGDILLCDRYDGEDIGNAIGRNAVIRTEDGRQLLRRVIKGGRENTYTLVPLDPGPVQYDVRLEWAAVLRSLHRKLD